MRFLKIQCLLFFMFSSVSYAGKGGSKLLAGQKKQVTSMQEQAGKFAMTIEDYSDNINTKLAELSKLTKSYFEHYSVKSGKEKASFFLVIAAIVDILKWGSEYTQGPCKAFRLGALEINLTIYNRIYNKISINFNTDIERIKTEAYNLISQMNTKASGEIDCSKIGWQFLTLNLLDLINKNIDTIFDDTYFDALNTFQKVNNPFANKKTLAKFLETYFKDLPKEAKGFVSLLDVFDVKTEEEEIPDFAKDLFFDAL